MTTTVPGHRPRAFVVAAALIALMVMLFAAIFAGIHRKISEDLANPVNPQGFRALLGHALSPHPITHPGFHQTPSTWSNSTKDIKTLRAQPPGDLRRVEDEIAELTKDLTPPSSPECSQPEPAVEPDSRVETHAGVSKRAVETPSS